MQNKTGPIETMVSGGTFDLPTIGHYDMWLEAARSCKNLVIVIANNPDKRPIFSPRERFEMIMEMVKDIPNAEVHVMNNKYLVRYAREIGATDVFRGLRDYRDLMEEQVASAVNRIIEPSVTTKLFIPDINKFQISSSMVMSLVGFEGWEKIVAIFVPPVVLAKLKDWHYTRTHWRDFWNAVDAMDDQAVMWNNISSRYGQDHRVFHNLGHITHCLREFDAARHLAKDPLALEMAIWYHDIVYEPRAKDNEARSAKFAAAAARKMGLEDAFGKRVAKLVKATSHQTIPKNYDARILLDIDLAILGHPPVVFDRYERGIREEDGFVPEQEYAEKRMQILNPFLKRRHIYSTVFFQEKYEDAAIANLERSIDKLSEVINR